MSDDARKMTDVVSPNEERLVDALTEYQSMIDAGQSVVLDDFLGNYSDIAADLAECLSGMELIQQVAQGDLDRISVDGTSNLTRSERQLGDFVLIREIGRGGMGVVYESEQISLGRRVALKILPFATLLDSRQLERFKNESRAAALLKHPNIVSVFQVGYERGTHYYAMELVDGLSLADILRQQELERENTQSPDEPESGISTRQTQAIANLSTRNPTDHKSRLQHIGQIGIEVARALDYAHRQGIVHRDIKPSNLMLDSNGNPSITDFGLARIEGSTELTMTGDVIGTLRYMSPEQAAGRQARIDERTDIYSLGVTLYELLTTKPAFSGDDRAKLLAQISNEEPPRLRKLNPRIPKDLETIIHKAIEKEPFHRYESAGAFADDLQRYLDTKPIRARKSTSMRRFTTWAKRNKSLATALGVSTVLSLLLAIGGPVAAIKQAQLAREAKASQEAAQRLLDFSVTEVAKATKNQPGMWRLQQTLWEGIVTYYEGLIQKDPNDIDVQIRLGKAYFGLAYALDCSSQPSQFEFYAKAIEQLERAIADSDNPAGYLELARAHNCIAHQLTIREGPNEITRGHSEKALTISRRLVANDPSVENLRVLALSLAFSRDDAALNEGFEVQRQLVNRFSQDEDIGRYSFYGMMLCGKYRDEGRWTDLMALLSDLEALQFQHAAAMNHAPEAMITSASIHSRCAGYYRAIGDHARAIESYRTSIDIGKRVVAAYPDNDWGRSSLQESYRGLSFVQLAMGITDEAEATIAEAMEHTHPTRIQFAADAEFHEARLMWHLGQRQEASEAFRKSIDFAVSLVDTDKLAGHKKRLLRFLVFCPDEASVTRDQAQRAVQLAKQMPFPERGTSHRLRGISEYRAGNWQSAINALEQSCEKRNGGDAIDWLYLAMAYAKNGNAMEARRYLKRATDAIDSKRPILYGFHSELGVKDLCDEATTLVNTPQEVTNA